MRYSRIDAEFENGQTDSLWEELVRVTAIADYAATVKRLTNYEVWKSVQSALPSGGPGGESEEGDWRNLRILLDELNWRHSGLEGPASRASNFSGETGTKPMERISLPFPNMLQG